jgi:hypothetical protein
MLEDIKALINKNIDFGKRVQDKSTTDFTREYWVGYTDSLGELLETLDEYDIGDKNERT